MRRLLLFIVIGTIATGSCTRDKGNPLISQASNCDTSITYTQTIAPIISQYCSTTPGCHVTGFTAGDFTSYAGLKIKLDAGVFQNRVFVVRDMPQTPNPPLPDSVFNKLKCWVDEGYPNN
ncbi:MAG: hypothetical protein AB1458_03255 [Bacteroidota bacterium]